MIGKQPCVVAGGVGFIANRLQMAMFCEAARCVEEGLASPRDIDEVVRSCFGFRLPFFGPFQIADMAGLDVYEAVVEQHEQGLGERFRVPDTLRRLVREGRCGTAAGGGFYDYEPGASERLLVERDTLYASLSGLLEGRPPPSFDGGRPRDRGRRPGHRNGRRGRSDGGADDRERRPGGGARRQPRHVERLRGPGLRIDVMGEERVVVLDAHASVDELTGPFDFGLITLKAPNIPDVLPALQERGLVDVFVSLGNGLVQQRVAAIVGADRLIAGTRS